MFETASEHAFWVSNAVAVPRTPKSAPTKAPVIVTVELATAQRAAEPCLIGEKKRLESWFKQILQMPELKTPTATAPTDLTASSVAPTVDPTAPHFVFEAAEQIRSDQCQIASAAAMSESPTARPHALTPLPLKPV